MAARQLAEKFAYILWTQNGKPSGRDLEFWLKAEKLVHMLNANIARYYQNVPGIKHFEGDEKYKIEALYFYPRGYTLRDHIQLCEERGHPIDVKRLIGLFNIH